MGDRSPVFSPEVLARINRKVAEEPDLSRRRLSLQVCEWLDWRCPMGRPRQMSCRVRLLDLHRKGQIMLPPPRRSFTPRSRAIQEPAEPPPVVPVSGDLAELGPVELVLVRPGDRELLSIHNALIESYHYLGTSRLCGAQLRYLVRCQAGWIAALSFSASALQCAPRDQFIGWSVAARRRNRQRVLCNSRFLIRPEVCVEHLATHLLGMATNRLRKDWREAYGIDPVLVESFVDPQKFEGTCYQAANWREVGQTTGRGRNNRKHKAERFPKKILLHPLHRSFRRILCEEPPAPPAPPLVPLPVEEALEESWSECEFGGADLPDKRLNRRLHVLAERFAACPRGAISTACQGKAETKAAYRFIDHEATTLPKILAPHYEATRRRCASEKVVFAAQDSSFLNYTAHPATEDLGPIGHVKQTLQGLVVHDTLAFDAEGVPLGLLDLQCWARDPKKKGKKQHRKRLPIEEKESYKWLKSYEAACQLQARAPETMVVSVGDREADIYELFKMARDHATPAHLLVRAMHDRSLGEGQSKLWDEVSKEKAQTWKTNLRRSGSRQARAVELEVRWKEIALKSPRKKDGAMKFWAVHAVEKNPAKDTAPIEWMLLTTIPVTSFKEACERIGWYGLRWGIEVFHRTLKSGCRIEDRQAATAGRLETCLAIDAVVAWRVMLLTMLARHKPEVPCTSFFTGEEWRALFAYCREAPKGTPTLVAAMLLVAKIGGFLGRKSDGFPGCTPIWRGLEKLDTIVLAWRAFGPPARPP